MSGIKIGIFWFVVLGFNATLTVKVISLQSVKHMYFTPVPTLISFQSHQLLSSHASAEVREETKPKRNFASTESRTHNNQVMRGQRSNLVFSCLNKNHIKNTALQNYVRLLVGQSIFGQH